MNWSSSQSLMHVPLRERSLGVKQEVQEFNDSQVKQLELQLTQFCLLIYVLLGHFVKHLDPYWK